MPPTLIETAPAPPRSGVRPVPEPATADDWSRLIRALAATDPDDLPLFGRLPG